MNGAMKTKTMPIEKVFNAKTKQGRILLLSICKKDQEIK